MKLPGVLANLNEEQHGLLVSWLSMGKLDGQITDLIIENEWVPKTVKRDTVLRNVNRWRKGKGQQAVMQQLAAKMTNPQGKLKRQVDVLEEMTTIAMKQKDRIAKLAAKEDPTPMLLQTVTEEMKTYYTMLEKLGRLQLDTGILRRVRTGEVEGDYADVEEVAEEEDGEAQEVFTEEDKRILMIIDQSLKAAE